MQNSKKDALKNTSVLIAAPINQDRDILKKYLNSLQNIKAEYLRIDFMFIDDNIDEQSSEILKKFSDKFNNVKIINSKKCFSNNFKAHEWSAGVVNKVTNFRNAILKEAREGGYDYLFTVDSDILLCPKTLLHLIQRKKDIISEIFWTRWLENDDEFPQVWVSNFVRSYEEEWSPVELPNDEKRRREKLFFKMLRKPGLYQVGGLGACTLISKKVLLSSVSYKKIPNIDFLGEDRHFCIRAVVLGFELFVDTVYPAFHIFRKESMDKAIEFEKNNNYINYI
jgi:GT2 family glycosyltransferase